jgi:hypothetical protein
MPPGYAADAMAKGMLHSETAKTQLPGRKANFS